MIANSVIYVIAALCFLVFAVLAALSWKGRAVGLHLVAASIVSAVWAITIAMKSIGWAVPFGVLWILEVGRAVAWLWFLYAVAQKVLPRVLSKVVLFTCVASLIAIPTFWILPDKSIGSVTPIRVVSICGMAMSFLSLVILEQIYRNVRSDIRNAARYLAVGLGAVFFFDLYLFAQVELLRGFKLNEWMVRGVINVISVPFVLISARRFDEWSIDVFVSRHVVFYSAAFTAVGVYLIAMAGGAYYINLVGGTWGVAAQIVFFLFGGVALVWMLFSRTLWRRIKVFINKHFFRNKYEYRLEWLKFIETLSAYGDRDVRQVALYAVTDVIKSSSGVLFYIDSEQLSYAPVASCSVDNLAAKGMDAFPEINISENKVWIDYIRDRKWIVDLEEYRSDPNIYKNIILPKWIVDDAGWRLLSPIFFLDELVGFLLLDEPPAPFDFNYEDRDLLITLGKHIAIHLSQYAANKKLNENRQFETFNRLTAYMMHDLKNAVAQMSLLVVNAKKHRGNPEFIDDAMITIDGVGKRIEKLIEQLRGGIESNQTRRVSLKNLLSQVLENLSIDSPNPKLSVGEVDLIVNADPDKLMPVFSHLVKNAQEATGSQGKVELSMYRHGNKAVVEISDDGEGMDEQFIREKLFLPFYTTKGSRGMGIGVYQAREYVRSLCGELFVESVVRRGTKIRVEVPLAEFA